MKGYVIGMLASVWVIGFSFPGILNGAWLAAILGLTGASVFGFCLAMVFVVLVVRNAEKGE